MTNDQTPAPSLEVAEVRLERAEQEDDPTRLAALEALRRGLESELDALSSDSTPRGQRIAREMARRQRLDSELMRRGLATSRTDARRAIEEGRVLLRGMPATRVATLVDQGESISLKTSERAFVSRGGDKLDGALRDLGIEVSGRRWLDAGASTGGFSDRLLQGGAEAVIALDVGYGQLDWALRNDPRVTVIERFNVRNLRPDDLPFVPDGVVAVLSFISLTLVLPSLARCGAPGADYLLLVKPQFEVGKEAVGRGGVVRDPAAWSSALRRVVAAASELGLRLAGSTLARPAGPAGNREFFLHLNEGGAAPASALEDVVQTAAEES